MRFIRDLLQLEYACNMQTHFLPLLSEMHKLTASLEKL